VAAKRRGEGVWWTRWPSTTLAGGVAAWPYIGVPMAWQPDARPCNLCNRVLTLKIVMVVAWEEIQAALA